jgi:hypothetical protein
MLLWGAKNAKKLDLGWRFDETDFSSGKLEES